MKKMNESGYALHILWDKIRCEFKKIKRVYLLLPLLYLMLSIAVIKNYEIYSNDISHHNYDSYRIVTLSNSDKLEDILSKYHLSKDEFNVLAAICLSEAKQGSYEDAYAVINTIYNRTHSKNWVSSVNRHFGNGKGYSMYYQAISPGQFTVYHSGSYKRHLGETNSKGYQAIIDFLYTEDIMHDYLSFRAHWINVSNSESFAVNGNNYFNKITEKNRI